MDEGLGGPLNIVYDGSLNPLGLSFRANGLIPGRIYTFKLRTIDINRQWSDS